MDLLQERNHQSIFSTLLHVSWGQGSIAALYIFMFKDLNLFPALICLKKCLTWFGLIVVKQVQAVPEIYMKRGRGSSKAL